MKISFILIHKLRHVTAYLPAIIR